MIFGHFIDFGHFPIEIPIEVGKMLGRAFQTCNLKNKNCSELLKALGMGLDRAPIIFQKFFFLNPLLTDLPTEIWEIVWKFLTSSKLIEFWYLGYHLLQQHGCLHKFKVESSSLTHFAKNPFWSTKSKLDK